MEMKQISGSLMHWDGMYLPHLYCRILQAHKTSFSKGNCLSLTVSRHINALTQADHVNLWPKTLNNGSLFLVFKTNCISQKLEIFKKNCCR